MDSEEFVKGMGRMFYIASPNETSFPNLQSLPAPSFIAQAPPYFFGLIFLEWTVKLVQGETPRINDGMLSVIHGLLMMLMEMIVSSSVGAAYIFVHTHYCLYQLPWDSPITWIIAAVGIDFCYYWV